MSVERQELHCHNCDQYVQFDLDTSIDGNHVLNCPNCEHEHCRVVKNGKITDIRWDQRNGPAIYISSGTITCTGTSTYTAYISTSTTVTSSGTMFLYQSWMNSGTVS